MNFDPAVTAREALTRAYVHDDLGDMQPDIEEAEETFSSEAGLEAKRAYETLIAIGETLPDARAFQEFLIFITWQQVTEEPFPAIFTKAYNSPNNSLPIRLSVKGPTCTSVSSRFDSLLNKGWATAVNQCRTSTIVMRFMAAIDSRLSALKET